jgi:hypothetical protein
MQWHLQVQSSRLIFGESGKGGREKGGRMDSLHWACSYVAFTQMLTSHSQCMSNCRFISKV